MSNYKGICAIMRETIGDGRFTVAELRKIHPDVTPKVISATLNTLCRLRYLEKDGPSKRKTYFKFQGERKPVKKPANIVRPFVGNVFARKKGKLPHFIDPRRDCVERQNLAMMAR